MLELLAASSDRKALAAALTAAGFKRGMRMRIETLFAKRVEASRQPSMF